MNHWNSRSSSDEFVNGLKSESESSIESEENSDTEKEQNEHNQMMSETPPIDFDSEEDSNEVH